MTRVFTWLEKHFTICFTVAVLFGTLLPRYVRVFDERGVMYALVVVLTFSFLKVDLADVLTHAKRPLLLLYALALNLVAMPALTYVASSFFGKETQIGLVLLVALPTGVAAAAICGMVGGCSGLTLLMCVLSSLLAPFTIPAIFYLLFGTRVDISYGGLLVTLLILVAIPLAASQLMKWLMPRGAKLGCQYGGGISVLILCGIIMSVIAGKSEFIREHVAEVFLILGALYATFIAIQMLSYFMGFWLNADEKLGLSVSKTVMNNALGIVVATQFFPDAPRIALVLILSEIPWSTVPALYGIYKRLASAPAVARADVDAA